MLTPAQRAIIRSTVPLLETNGEILTRHFYQRLLDDNPSVRTLFNEAHQTSGDQARALARSVLLYARRIDHLEAMGPLVQQIVNKHVSLQVQAEHYPLVGIALLRSIRTVLGVQVATDAVIDAWAAAYGQLANLLIAAEAQRYAEQEEADGGWRGARSFRIVRIEPESEEISSFYLAPVDDQPVLRAQPGQYIGLRVVIDGVEHRRHYSLSAPADGKGYRISVKHQAGGKVSGYLHTEAHEGQLLDVLGPAGHFVLHDSQRPLLFIAAGVGITPVIPMLAAALPTGRPIKVIHCTRKPGVQAFASWLESQAARHSNLQVAFCYSAPDNDESKALRLDQRRLRRSLGKRRDIDAYVLGPTTFMTEIRRNLKVLGVPGAQIHHECFGPTVILE